MNLALLIARGLSSGPGPGAPKSTLGEPLVTEAPGRRTSLPSLSDMELRVAQNRGISPDAWRKLSDTSNPVLE